MGTFIVATFSKELYIDQAMKRSVEHNTVEASMDVNVHDSPGKERTELDVSTINFQPSTL